MFLNGYPYTDFHEMNLDFLMQSMNTLKQAFKDFTASNSLIFAEPLLHDLTKSYAKNTIVLDSDGNAYISTQLVPEGVQLDDSEYWLMVFNFEQYTEKANKNFTDNYFRDVTRSPIALAVGDWVVLDDVLYKVTVAIDIDGLFVIGTNIVHFTVEQFLKDFTTSVNQSLSTMSTNITNYYNSMQSEVDRILAGATVDSEVIDARLGANGHEYSTLGNAIRSQFGVSNRNEKLLNFGNNLTQRDWSPNLQYPTGWTNGYWDDTGHSVVSDSAIRCRLRYSIVAGGTGGDCAYYAFEFPSDKQMVIKIFDGTEDTLLNRYDLYGGFGMVNIPNGTRFTVFLRLYDGDASDYATDPDYIAQIKWYMMKSQQKKPRTDEFERFTVKTTLSWPDVEDTTSANNDNYVEEDIKCILSLPTSYQPNGRPVRLIMFGHGTGCQITDSEWYGNQADFLDMIRAFTAAGFAVFDVNNTRDQTGGYQDWGCLPLMEAYIRAWEYIKRYYNVEDVLYILADSMGTMAALNMLKWYPSQIKTAVITAPRPFCKLRYENMTGTDKTEMANAFGLSGTTWEDDRLKGFNGYENVVQIDSTDYVFEEFPPIKVLAGTADTFLLDESRAYFNALANSGNYVNYREIAGATHNDMKFLSLGTLKDECVNWMKRFR